MRLNILIKQAKRSSVHPNTSMENIFSYLIRLREKAEAQQNEKKYMIYCFYSFKFGLFIVII